MKRRKNESRTYFLDKMRERLNLRMQRDDAKENADDKSVNKRKEYPYSCSSDTISIGKKI